MANKPRNPGVKKTANVAEKPLSAAQDASPPVSAPVKTAAKTTTPVAAKPAKPAVAKSNGAKPVAKSAAKPAAAKPVAVKPVAAPAAKPAAKPAPAAPVAAAASEAPAKHKKDAKKAKLVRDSFTLPENDYVLFAAMKARCLACGIEVKKSELLRAALRQLSGLDDAMLVAVMSQIEKIKTGRPAG